MFAPCASSTIAVMHAHGARTAHSNTPSAITRTRALRSSSSIASSMRLSTPKPPSSAKGPNPATTILLTIGSDSALPVDASDRAVGEHIGGIGDQLGRRDDRDPARIDILEDAADRVGAGHMRDRDHRDGGDRGGQGGRHQRLLTQQSAHRSDLTPEPMRSGSGRSQDCASARSDCLSDCVVATTAVGS